MSKSQISPLLCDALYQSQCRRHACNLWDRPQLRWLFDTCCIVFTERCQLSAYLIATAESFNILNKNYIAVKSLLECCRDVSQLKLTCPQGERTALCACAQTVLCAATEFLHCSTEWQGGMLTCPPAMQCNAQWNAATDVTDIGFCNVVIASRASFRDAAIIVTYCSTLTVNVSANFLP